SWAETGNTFIGSFPYVGSYGPELYGTQSAIAFDRVGNPELRWETSKKIDVGLDVGLFDNRITASFDYFMNDISDMVLQAPTPPTAGIPGNSIAKNVGTMVNKGYELTVSSDNLRSSSLEWTTDLT